MSDSFNRRKMICKKQRWKPTTVEEKERKRLWRQDYRLTFKECSNCKSLIKKGDLYRKNKPHVCSTSTSFQMSVLGEYDNNDDLSICSIGTNMSFNLLSGGISELEFTDIFALPAIVDLPSNSRSDGLLQVINGQSSEIELLREAEATNTKRLNAYQDNAANNYFKSLKNINCRIILGHLWQTRREVWNLVTITGDGHCFARVLAYYLFGDQHKYEQVKADFLTWFRRAVIEKPFIHQQLVETDYWNDEERTGSTIDWLQNNGKKQKVIWPDNVEELVLLFEFHLHRNIRVWTCIDGKFSGVCAGDQGSYPGELITLVNCNTEVKKIDCSHYSAVVQKDDWVV